MVLEGRLLIINIPPHLAWHPQQICERDWFWHREHRIMVRLDTRPPGYDKPNTLCRPLNAWQEWVTNHKKCMDL
jgi:hypothetical protein